MRWENKRNNTGNGRLIPAFPVLFRYFLSGRATIAKGSGNVPLSKFVRIACGYAEKSENNTGMSGPVLTEETAIRCENGRLSAFLFVFRLRRYTRMASGRRNVGK